MKTLLLSLLLLTGCASPGVVGVAYNKKGIVKYVFEGSNADKAGIKVEDKILNTKDLRGKVGTVIIVKLVRAGVGFELKIERQHIDTLKNPKGIGKWI